MRKLLYKALQEGIPDHHPLSLQSFSSKGIQEHSLLLLVDPCFCQRAGLPIPELPARELRTDGVCAGCDGTVQALGVHKMEQHLQGVRQEIPAPPREREAKACPLGSPGLVENGLCISAGHELLDKSCLDADGGTRCAALPGQCTWPHGVAAFAIPGTNASLDLKNGLPSRILTRRSESVW